jgi:hypothetical protein
MKRGFVNRAVQECGPGEGHFVTLSAGSPVLALAWERESAGHAMNWLRSKTKLVARVVLFALAVQLALSFGHVHRDDLVPPAAASALAASPVQQAADGPQSPAPIHKSDGTADDFCAICAFIQLANVSMPAAAPPLPPPVAVGWSRVETTAELHLAGAPRRFFQARGPPLT